MLNLKKKSKPMPDKSDGEYQHFRSKLKIDTDALDQALSEHPFCLQEVGEKYNHYASLRDEAKEEMERQASECALTIRSKADKITNDEVNARVSLEPKYLRASAKYFELAKQTALWLTLRESFLSRGYMLRELCGLYATQYWTKNSSVSPAADNRRVEHMRSKQK